MSIKKLLLTAVAATVLGTAGAGMAAADPYDHHRDAVRHEQRVDNRMDRRMDRRDDRRMERRDVRHDRYWRDGYHGYVDRDRVFFGLREHHYSRFVGDPFWYHGYYVVRTYDRFGRVVLVEVNPYTGAFIGVIRL